MSDEAEGSLQIPKNKELGGRIKAAMESKNMTQGKLALLSGLSQPFISDVVNGRRGISLAVLRKLAENLDTPVEGLVGSLLSIQPKAPVVEDEEDETPPGLDEFVARHGERLKITRRELSTLSTLRFRAEPWVIFDDSFWEKQLHLWRDIFQEQDKTPAVPSGAKVRKGG